MPVLTYPNLIILVFQVKRSNFGFFNFFSRKKERDALKRRSWNEKKSTTEKAKVTL
jgi:hypothetical protein